LKIVMPSTPYDAKGLLLSAILDNNPVCVFEHRWLMKKDGIVPEGFYRVPIGKGIYRKRGDDVTIVGASHAIELGCVPPRTSKPRVSSAEVIDLRTIKPMDEHIILESLEKTGRIVAVDTAWMKGGVCAEIGCLAAEKGFHFLKAPVARVGLPDIPTPAGYTLEQFYYSGRRAESLPPPGVSFADVLRPGEHDLGRRGTRGNSARLPVRSLHDGRGVRRFEEAFAAKFGMTHAVMVNSGPRRTWSALPHSATNESGRFHAVTKSSFRDFVGDDVSPAPAVRAQVAIRRRRSADAQPRCGTARGGADAANANGRRGQYPGQSCASDDDSRVLRSARAVFLRRQL
jgi:hypothetical protein